MMREREGRCETCDKRNVRLTYVAVGEWKGKRLCEECLVTRDALKRLKLQPRPAGLVGSRQR